VSDRTPVPPDGPAPLARRRRLARLALAWEAIWPAIWPALGVLGLFLTIALLGLPLLLPGWMRPLLGAGFAAAFAIALWRGLRGFRWPGDAPADRRLERESGLLHRPLSALADRPATDDPLAQAVWEVHRARALASIRALRVGMPRPGLARRDPVALRAALALSLLAALIIAGPEATERLRRAVVPPVALATLPPPMRLEAWVTPPAYTGAAPVFLDAAGGDVSVPAGSRLQIALSGGTGGVPELQIGNSAAPFRALDARSFGAEAVLEQGARLVIRRDAMEVAAWNLAVQSDQPPRASFPEPPARAPRGLATRLPWQAEDDWGVASLSAEIRLKARPDAAPYVIEIPLPAGQPRQARGAAGPDLSTHPWAGLDVEVLLRARDGAGQEGVSGPATVTLPERSFNHPVAQQLIALRKMLSLDPDARAEARRILDRIAAAPEAFEHDTVIYLALRSAQHRLRRDQRPEAVTEAQEMMWQMALALEEGRAERTARALQQAREALREALQEAERQQQQQGERQTEQRTETERRIQELRDAVRRHLEALAEQLQRENAEAMPFDPQNRLMDRRDLDRRTERMREANREDRTQDAERELAELEEMLRTLEEGRSARNEQQERRRQGRQRGEQQMGVVQDLVQREARMLDSGHRRAESGAERLDAERRIQQQQQRSPWVIPPQSQQEQQQRQREEAQQQALAEAQREARTQRALRRALGEVMQQFGDLTGEVPPQLGRADQAMREAQEQLGEGRDARDAQQRAIRELVEGARQMAQQMQRQFGQSGGEGEDEGEDAGDMFGEGQGPGDGRDQAQEQGPGRDPLGRRTREAPGAQDAGSDTRVPDEAEQLRTRRLQDELRRRGAERERPQEELDYIDRLLRRF
jgi:uncharacterized protein (TIGR02302 family)